jgi:hypothetical protein
MGKPAGHVESGPREAVLVLVVVYVVLSVSPSRTRHGSLDKLPFASTKEPRSRVWMRGCAGGDTDATMAMLV